jgi:hypothetical protein
LCDFGSKSLPVDIEPGEKFEFVVSDSVGTTEAYDVSIEFYFDQDGFMEIVPLEYQVAAKLSDK